MNGGVLVLVVSFAAGWPARDGTQCVEYLTVCAPPRCEASSPLVQRALAVGRATGRDVRVLGRDASMRNRALKLEIVGAHTRQAGCDVVVFADATDVIAGTGSVAATRNALRDATGGRENVVVAAAEPACWIGVPCSAREADGFLRAMYGRAPSLNMSFANSGQYAGSREAVRAFTAWAIKTSEALPRELPAVLSARRGKTAEKLDDQGLLLAYAATFPDRVALDDRGVLFGSLKRWFVLDGEPQDAVVFEEETSGEQLCFRSSSAAPATAAWFHPPCGSGMRTIGQASSKRKKKRFATGFGRHCVPRNNNQSRTTAGARLAWCSSREAPGFADLVYDASESPNDGGYSSSSSSSCSRAVRPLLGWHGNGLAAHGLLSTLLDLKKNER